MKITTIAILCLLCASCADSRKEPLLSDAVRGEWARIADPTRHYIFEDDYISTWVYNFSTIIAPKWYRADYSGAADLTLSEINTDQVLRWKFSDVTQFDTICTVADYTNHPTFYFDLKRVK